MIAHHDVDVGDSGYGRRSVIAVSIDTVDGIYCDYCKQVVKDRVLYMEGSDGEYVCELCVTPTSIRDYTPRPIQDETPCMESVFSISRKACGGVSTIGRQQQSRKNLLYGSLLGRPSVTYQKVREKYGGSMSKKGASKGIKFAPEPYLSCIIYIYIYMNADRSYGKGMLEASIAVRIAADNSIMKSYVKKVLFDKEVVCRTLMLAK